MSETVETETVAVEAAVTTEVAVAEPPQPAEKPVKEKKPKAPREKKPKAPKTASHPPYFQMIKEALLALNDKSGSSPYAIAKYMEGKHKEVLPANFKKILGLQLKNSAARGKLIKIKASYKLSEVGKKEKTAAKASKTPKQARGTTAAKAKAMNKPETVKKPAKKVAAKKTKKSASAKPKQPKSIKSASAKKAKKATA